MAKLALVIGVSDYEPGLTPLPGAIRDTEAMQRVLQHPEMGGFDDVKTLINPEPLMMQEAIETLFSGRAKDDLVLLFFSGHGVKDESGKLHLATRITRKNTQGELIRATSVPASFVQEIMGNSRSRRQIVILDCCFSGAFAEGWSAKDDGSVDVKTQLGGEGRAVLTSSASTQYSFEQEGSGLSTYTRYLVEGIETGAADLDSDGVVSVDELHEYAKGKVQEAAPAMKPEIYAVKEGYRIHLSQAPVEDPKLRYRKEVEHCASRGEISDISRYTLDALRESLELQPEEAVAIENEVLEPYRKYQKKLQRYEQVLTEAFQREHPLSTGTLDELKRLQRVLSLRDEDIAQVEAKVVVPQKTVSQPTGGPASLFRGQSLFHQEDKAVATPIQTVATVQPKTSQATDAGLSGVAANPGTLLRNPKVLIGGGVAALFLAVVFLANMPQSEPDTGSSSSVESSAALTSAQDYYTEGEGKFINQDYEGAIKDYSQAIELNPDHVEAYYNRGLAKHFLEDYEGAIADYDKALTLNPDYTKAYYDRGNAKSNLGDYRGAIADYEQLLQRDPNHANAYYGLGVAKVLLGDNQAAIADYNRSIELDPTNASVFYERGKSKYRLDDYKAAIADYDEAIKLNPDYAEAYYERGVCKALLGDNQGAIVDYDQAAKLDPSNALTLFERGKSKYRLGDYQGASADYDLSIQVYPDNANVYYERGNAKAALGDNQGALPDYQKAAEMYKNEGQTKAYQDTLTQISKIQ